MKLTLHIDVFFCAKARRAIENRASLAEALTHDYADEYSYKSDSALDCECLKEIIEEQFDEYEIPSYEYEITIA